MSSSYVIFNIRTAITSSKNAIESPESTHFFDLAVTFFVVDLESPIEISKIEQYDNYNFFNETPMGKTKASMILCIRLSTS